MLLSMAVNGPFESDPDVDWIEHGQGRVSFTLTPSLHEAMQQGGRKPGYRCRNHRFTMRGDFTVTEPPPPPPVPPTVPFSLGPVEDIELGNDAQLGPDVSSNGSETGARDIEVRRRVFLVSYDISSLTGREDLAQVSFNLVSHNIHDETDVYGVVEDMDLLEVESLTWNTAPGVQNDPTPELSAPVALDMGDLTDVWLSFEGPGETLVRFPTDTSAALAEFINSDTDGILTFLFAPAADGSQLIVRSREQALGGTLLEGVAAPVANITWMTEDADRDANGVPDDQGFIDLLTDAGYLLDVQPDRWKALEDLGANDANDYVAELNAADLVIISRTTNSGDYDDGNEPTLWNGVTSPVLQMSAYLPRSSRWRWINSTSISNQEAPIMIVVDANHPVLAGVAVDPDGLVFPLDGSVGSGQTSFLATADAGNGSVIATTLAGDLWVVEWAAGAEFYEGSGQVAGGTATGQANSIFRAHRYGPDHPALQGKDLDPNRHANLNRLLSGRT